MMSRSILTVALVSLTAAVAGAGETVGVDGSSTEYVTPIETAVGKKQVKMVLTGTALRKKFIFNVYAIGSYLEEGIRARTAEELAAKDCAKQLHLVMERDVGGKEMAEAFRAAIRKNYPEPDFSQELDQLIEFMQALSIEKGDQVLLTHVPKAGLHCKIVGKAEILVENVAFAQAVWEIYLGKNNLGQEIKKGLVSRL